MTDFASDAQICEICEHSPGPLYFDVCEECWVESLAQCVNTFADLPLPLAQRWSRRRFTIADPQRGRFASATLPVIYEHLEPIAAVRAHDFAEIIERLFDLEIGARLNLVVDNEEVAVIVRAPDRLDDNSRLN